MSKQKLVFVTLFVVFTAMLGYYAYLTYGSALFGGKGASTKKAENSPKSFENLPDYQAGNPRVNQVPESLRSKGTEAQLSEVTITTVASPLEVTINSGDIVTFINADTAQHQIVGAGDLWGSQLLQPDDKFSQEFDVPGVYPYTDKESTTVTGKITVK
ncbi:hypothetical protein COT49_02145 [candidate division WWE3 bacterium CG08_land_8_20_14_0_20_40_13]|uniref:EfeO-type cupredoxin-like domain-containing protein n=1 Tax=candidate division WWE3 bacterium CG08_land_8_20_14_0_20_40_13 TaxID=1975084 RepID=A0A2H0XDM8_UNCKA|nr:MAG: hypothetical protein COT49_02145 [candidate division WWE3 bacterium CG08_land_8_20_14_0_20_40_13]